MGLERCREGRDSIQVGVSIASGIAEVLAAEAIRVSNSGNEIVQLYEQNGAVSRLIVAAVVAISSYYVLEENLPKPNEK